MVIFVVATYLLIPAMMIFLGSIWMRKPPTKINHLYGYRTKRSMADPTSWEFAHKYMGKIWFYSGLFLLAATLIFFWVYPPKLEEFGRQYVVFVYIQMGVMIMGIWPTERSLKQRFDEESDIDHKK